MHFMLEAMLKWETNSWCTSYGLYYIRGPSLRLGLVRTYQWCIRSISNPTDGPSHGVYPLQHLLLPTILLPEILVPFLIDFDHAHSHLPPLTGPVPITASHPPPSLHPVH